MRCDRLEIPGGFAIVCSRGDRRPKPLLCDTPTCRGKRAFFLCDHPTVKRGRTSMCGRRLCKACRMGRPDGPDYCAEHGRQLALFG